MEAVGSRNRFLTGWTAALVFALLAGWVMSGHSLRFDNGLRALVHGWASPRLTWGMQAVTGLGSELFLLPLGAVLCWRLTATGRRRAALVLAGASLSAELLTQLLKLALHRPRPAVFFGLPVAPTYSFPSGHAFVSTVFFGLLVSLFLAAEPSRGKRAAWAALVTLGASLIGLSRVYLGYHYPSDVLGGWAAAAAWLALFHPAENGASQPQEKRG